MDILIKIIIVYTILYYILFKVCLYNIFKKEKVPGKKSLIPIYDFWMYFKFLKIPRWLIFIPILNIIAFISSPYKLSKRFNLKKWTWTLSIFFPFIFVPYVAFSNKKDIYLERKNNYYKNQNDIDNLEEKLKNETTESEYIDAKKEENIQIEKTIQINEFNIDEEIIEESLEKQQDIEPDPTLYEKVQYNINDELIIDEVVSKNDYNSTNETVEELDDVNNNTKIISNNTIDEIDNNTNNKDYYIKKQIQEFENVGPSDKAIAFGGKERIENKTTAKLETLKCPRCGSSLIGSNNICPGCGLNLQK